MNLTTDRSSNGEGQGSSNAHLRTHLSALDYLLPHIACLGPTHSWQFVIISSMTLDSLDINAVIDAQKLVSDSEFPGPSESFPRTDSLPMGTDGESYQEV